MSNQIKGFYEFESFTIDASKRLLLRGGEPVPLKPKVFDTLLVLVENSGRVLDKDELMEMIWPDAIVEENNLTQNISAIRRALDDRRDEHRYVVTVPGRGYRFVADVHKAALEEEARAVEPELKQGATITAGMPVENGRGGVSSDALIPPPAAKHHWRIAGAASVLFALLIGVVVVLPRLRRSSESNPAATNAGPSKAIESIAVLPFKPLGSETSDEYIGLGMADALITKLSNSRQLTVRSTSAVLRYNNHNQDSLVAGR